MAKGIIDANEIIVRAEQTPGQVSFYNYEELKEYLEKGLSVYNTTEYTEENIDQAKADLKELNSIKKKLEVKKKELENAYSLPIEEVRKQLDELLGMVKEPMKIRKPAQLLPKDLPWKCTGILMRLVSCVQILNPGRLRIFQRSLLLWISSSKTAMPMLPIKAM